MSVSIHSSVPTTPAPLPAAVNELVLSHLRGAEAIARRFTQGSPDWRDLQQVAYMGLVKAARRFDPRRGDEFVSYAVPTIRGEIKRYLRDSGWIVRPPREIQELRSQLSSEIPRLSQALGREPTPTDLAVALKQDLHQVEQALGAGNSMRPASLDAALSDGQRSATLADGLATTDPGLERAEQAAVIAQVCQHLTGRERRIVYMRFYEEKTQQQIGRELGVTQMQVSRLLRQILTTLRQRLQPSSSDTSSSTPSTVTASSAGMNSTTEEVA